jgi:hypothetical protein
MDGMVMPPFTDRRKRPRGGRQVSGQNIALSAAERAAAIELAERYHGGNISLLFRSLLKMRLAMEPDGATGSERQEDAA